MPVYSIFKATGHTKIDYFALDVEGAEFSIMEAAFKNQTDFQFSVATIENAHMDSLENKGSFLEFGYMMKRNGYKNTHFIGHDAIYTRK